MGTLYHKIWIMVAVLWFVLQAINLSDCAVSVEGCFLKINYKEVVGIGDGLIKILAQNLHAVTDSHCHE
jgi:hypothetical protein